MVTNDKNKESIIAITLISLCLFALVIGLFGVEKNLKSKDKSEKSISLGSDKVAVIGLEGEISDSFYEKSPFRDYLNAASLKRNLKAAIEDKHTKAVLLRVNSPGGTVATSQEIYDLVKAVQASGKPVVVSMSDVCASGCYYIASAADHIVANRGTITGSIGVISHSLNFKGLMDRFGVQDQTFKAGKYKDLGSSTRTLSEEDRTILQKLLDNSYDQFVSDVSVARKLPREEVEKIAQGLIYTGVQALEVKLVDSLGSYDDAKAVTRQVLKKKYAKADTIRFEETWKQNSISGFDQILDLGLSESINRFFFSKLSSLAPSQSYDVIKSPYQVMWLMQ